MLGNFGLEGVLRPFNSSHRFCLSLSLLCCVLVFWEVTAVSLSFFFRPTCLSSGTLMIDVGLLISWNLLYVFDLLIDVFSLAYFLVAFIEVPFLLNISFHEFIIVDGLYQVFQYSVISLLAKLAILWFFAQSRRLCDNTLSFDKSLLAKRESAVIFVLFRQEVVVKFPFQLLAVIFSDHWRCIWQVASKFLNFFAAINLQGAHAVIDFCNLEIWCFVFKVFNPFFSRSSNFQGIFWTLKWLYL